MKPVVFDGCFGWLHPAAGTRGVVLCASLGYEALCTHRVWRVLAKRLAAAGCPTLRFDYPGTGDSAGTDEEPERLRAWIDGIKAAVRTLRAETGVTEVALVGLRVGGMLATLAAEELNRESGLESGPGGGRVDRLVLLAPWLTGSGYVQRLKAIARLNASADGTAPPRREQSDDIEYGGFVLTAETQAELCARTLLDLRHRPASEVLVLNHGGTRDVPALVAKLGALGSTVTQRPFEGFIGLMRDALKCEVPEDAFRAVAEWLGTPAAPSQDDPATGDRAIDDRTIGDRTTDDRAGIARLDLGASVEQPIFFNSTPRLFGILSQPTAAPPAGDRPAVLFLNTGVNHHIGSCRMSVALARRLAARGIASLRIDTAGIGDSETRPGSAEQPEGIEDFVCSTTTCGEVARALDWMEAQGYRKCVVVGLCSGALIGLHVALNDPRIAGLVMINGQRFHLATPVTAAAVAKKRLLRALRSRIAWISNSACPKWWQVALRAGIRFTHTVTTNPMHKLNVRLRKLRDALYAAQADSDTPEALMRRLSQRRVPTLFVYSELDNARTIMEHHFERDMAMLRTLPGIRVERIDGADHTLTLRSLRAEFAALFDQHLDACGATASVPSPAPAAAPLGAPLAAPPAASASPASADTMEVRRGAVPGVWCPPQLPSELRPS